MNLNAKKVRGFTLIEILVVIGIIAVLAAIVIIAINPGKQFAQARNTQRMSNINSILNAVGQNLADNKGIFGGTCGALLTPVPPATTIASSSVHISGGTAAGHVDLSCLTPTYIPAFPVDPDTTVSNATDSGYEISVDAVGRVLICAPASNEPALGPPTPAAFCVKR